jgi:hypothetical protein
MPEWMIAAIAFWMYALGYLAAWGFAHQDEPFWRGFIDGLTFRRLWQRRF